MFGPRKAPLGRRRAAHGFTLIEILIVAALIGIFAGIAIFGVQQMYDDNRRKAMFDEAKQIGTGLSFAHDDLGFFPRIYLLGEPRISVVYQEPGNAIGRLFAPGLDTYGRLVEGSPGFVKVNDKWDQPYMGFTEARKRLSQGSRGLAFMRIPDNVNSQDAAAVQAFASRGIDVTLVQWPSDTWGMPWMLYEVTSDLTRISQGNPLGLRLAQAGEPGDFLTAVVSYGANQVPGGFDEQQFETDGTYQQFAAGRIIDMRESGMPFLIGDVGSGADRALGSSSQLNISPQFFTIRSFLTSVNDAQITPAVEAAIVSYVQWAGGGQTYYGILDDGSDDVVWRF